MLRTVEWLVYFEGIKASLPDGPLADEDVVLRRMKQPIHQLSGSLHGPSLQLLLLPQDGGGSIFCLLPQLKPTAGDCGVPRLLSLSLVPSLG